jgi:hypothetical protein
MASQIELVNYIKADKMYVLAAKNADVGVTAV